jgi:3-hydroxy-9,10-secoandrosta-1,3,5(10)-triene-9,17-dione monooxygenase
MADVDTRPALNVAAQSNLIPTEAELLQRARDLVPVLRDRAQACEDARQVLPENVEAFRSAGFYKVLQPAAYGGYEMHPMTMYRIVMEIAKGCPSSAWCLSILAIHNWEMALLDPQAAEDVWGTDPEARISSSYAPFGKVELVEGGYRVSGRWPWSSGSDQSSWALLGGFPPFEPGTMPDLRAFLIPRTDYEIHDNWHVLGLKGTGSKEIVVTDAFVPTYRTHRLAESFEMNDVGLKTFTSPNYKFPFGTVFVHCLAVSVLGMADGALEEFSRQMAERITVTDFSKANADPFVQQRVANASAMIRGLHQKLESNFAELDRLLAAGEPVPIPLRVAMKWDATFTAQTSMQAIELLFKACGGRGALLSNPMQRYFRDAHTASNHAALNPDKGALNAGAVAMGGPNHDFVV